MRNKVLALILLVVVFAGSCSGVRIIRRARRNIDTSLARVLVRGKLLIGVHVMPPYVIMDKSGVFSGFDIEIAREVARLLNVEIEFVPLAWAQVKNSLQEGYVDCLWGGFDASEFVGKPFIFSEDYVNSVLVLATPNTSNINSVEDARDQKIALISMADSLPAAGVVTTVLNDFTDLTLEHELEQCIQDILDNNVKGMVTDIFTATYYQYRGETSENVRSFSDFIDGMEMGKLTEVGRPTSLSLKFFNQPIRKRAYSVVFNEPDIALRDKINEALSKLEYNMVLENLSKRWFGMDIVVFGK